jgi:RND family efflux transporter MFP subunit
MTILKKFNTAGLIILSIALIITILKLSSDNASGIHREDSSPSKEAVQDNGDKGPASKDKRKIKYWVAPMDPNYIRKKPGKSPMGMDLVPVYEDDEAGPGGTVSIDPVTVQNMGVRTTKVSKGPLMSKIRTIGNVTYDEEQVEHIHTKVSGWVEELFVKTTGENIKKGQKLLSLYSPELVATEQEYLQAISYKEKVAGSSFPDVVKGADSLLESTKKRLLLMDISPEQIKSLEESRQVQREMILRSPSSGIVIKKHVFNGMKVTPGMELYTIAGLSRVWVIASIYEYELPFLTIGQHTEMTLPYEPGTKYHSKVTFIYPYLSPKTRTVQVRMEFDNPDLKLKPDMYTDVVITAKTTRNVLTVPSEAILRTGSRNVVITSLGGGKFLPKEVTVGAEGEGVTEILTGLHEGEVIVTSGQFLIDSESNLKEAIHKMLEAQEAEHSHKASKNEGAHEMSEMDMGHEHIVQAVIESYLRVYEALLSESVDNVAEQASMMASEIEHIKAADTKGQLKEIIDAMEASAEGLQSGNLQKARYSFKILSRSMAGFIRGAGREGAVSADMKLYFCSMAEEYWVQRGKDVKNPYFGKDMWICGAKEEF